MLSLLLLASAVVTVLGYDNPPQDMRRVVSNVGKSRVQEEVKDFLWRDSVKMVVIQNQAGETASLKCANSGSNLLTNPVSILSGNAFIFTFRPRKKSLSNYWCEAEYTYHFVRFEVFNKDLPCIGPRPIDEVYQYTITRDAVFLDDEGNGTEISAVFKKFDLLLWEKYDYGQPRGLLYSLLVGETYSRGSCFNLPSKANDRAEAVTVCNDICVKIYKHYFCEGQEQTVHSLSGCKNVGIDNGLKREASSLRRC